MTYVLRTELHKTTRGSQEPSPDSNQTLTVEACPQLSSDWQLAVLLDNIVHRLIVAQGSHIDVLERGMDIQGSKIGLHGDNGDLRATLGSEGNLALHRNSQQQVLHQQAIHARSCVTVDVARQILTSNTCTEESRRASISVANRTVSKHVSVWLPAMLFKAEKLSESVADHRGLLNPNQRPSTA